MECVELQEVRDLKKTLYERKRADVSSTRIRFIFKGTINMQKSTLALALASIIVMGGNTAVAGTPKYLNDQVDKVGHGIDWTETVSDTNERVALVNDGKAHSITGFNVINILHNAPGNNGSWKAENGSTLNISANEIRLSQKAVDAGRPNLIEQSIFKRSMMLFWRVRVRVVLLS